MSDSPRPTQPTRAELTQQKLRAVRALMDARANTADIKRTFAAKFKCQPRSAEPFIKQVAAQIRAETGKSVEEHRADAYAFYAGVVGNTQLPMRERLLAQKCMDRITGVAAPLKVAQTTVAGADAPQQKMTIEEAQAVLNAFKSRTKPPTAE